MRIGARRVAPRAAALAVTPMPKASLSRTTANIVHARAISTTGRLANALNTNPNPPLSKKNTSNESPSRIGLIGARGYTGQALIDLLSNHPNINLRYVSSRELAGQELKGYTKRMIIYESLSPEDVARLDKNGQVNAWGAGTKKSPKNDEALLKDNLMPYSLTGHIHEREISHHLGAPTAFIPHVASWFSGIQLTINIPLSKEMTSREIRQIYQDRYAGEKLVKVVGEAPQVKFISGLHSVEIGGFAVDDTGKRVVICATIDNLLKGAATQCLQNMNLALGYDEHQGIPIE
ncbi:hypothetical protein ACJ41O_009880 [Fusarium nematophilum]